SALSGEGEARSVAKASRSWGIQSRCTENPCPTFGSGTRRAPRTLATNDSAAGSAQTRSARPCRTIQGAVTLAAGANVKPLPSGLVEAEASSPPPRHHGLVPGRSGQKPRLRAPVNVLGGAWTRAA